MPENALFGDHGQTVCPTCGTLRMGALHVGMTAPTIPDLPELPELPALPLGERMASGVINGKPVELRMHNDEAMRAYARSYGTACAQAGRVPLTEQLRALPSDGDRLAVLRNFCLSCGSNDPRCPCWSDE